MSVNVIRRKPLFGAATAAWMFLGGLLVAGECFAQTNSVDKQAWLAPETLTMPREKISMSLPGVCIRRIRVGAPWRRAT